MSEAELQAIRVEQAIARGETFYEIAKRQGMTVDEVEAIYLIMNKRCAT